MVNTRNELCFQGQVWMGMKLILRKLVALLKSWSKLCKEEDFKCQMQGLIASVKGRACCGDRSSPRLGGSNRQHYLELDRLCSSFLPEEIDAPLN
jgi:hypothetical protein